MPLSTSNDAASEYDKLPESIKLYYSEQEYLWLSEQAKARLIQTETEPDEE